jgi:hypothetical protein
MWLRKKLMGIELEEKISTAKTPRAPRSEGEEEEEENSTSREN